MKVLKDDHTGVCLISADALVWSQSRWDSCREGRHRRPSDHWDSDSQWVGKVMQAICVTKQQWYCCYREMLILLGCRVMIPGITYCDKHVLLCVTSIFVCDMLRLQLHYMCCHQCDVNVAFYLLNQKPTKINFICRYFNSQHRMNVRVSHRELNLHFRSLERCHWTRAV